MYIKADEVTCFLYDFGLELQSGLHDMQPDFVSNDEILINLWYSFIGDNL